MDGQDMEIAISKPYSEFRLDLSSKQRVHSLRRKLFHANSILLNTQDLLEKIRIYENKLVRTWKLPISAHEDFQCQLENMLGELMNHTHTMQKLMDVSHDIRLMVSSK